MTQSLSWHLHRNNIYYCYYVQQLINKHIYILVFIMQFLILNMYVSTSRLSWELHSCPSCFLTLACLCWLAGQPPRSDPAQTSPDPPGRQRPPASPQVDANLLTIRAARRRRPSSRSIPKNSLNSLLVFLRRRFLSIPKGFSYLNERGYVSKQLDKWQKVQAPQQPVKSVIPLFIY